MRDVSRGGSKREDTKVLGDLLVRDLSRVLLNLSKGW